LLTRTTDIAKPGEAAAPAAETSAPTNFIISINGEEHPIQLNRPVTLQMGNREQKIVLRSAP
jgi:hypothetical protein